MSPTSYLGNAPCCYANTLAMTLGTPLPPNLLEVLTGSAFGYQRFDTLPLFDPPGWDPDLGIDQVLRVMGVDHRRETFADGGSALARLGELCAAGPVFVGPLEMGLLAHQPGSDRPIGADHFVAVLAVSDGQVVMHDPQGYPYAQLPQEDFLAAWGADTISYADGRFPLRTGFTTPTGTPERWLAEMLPYALGWATGRHALSGQRPGNADGLRELAQEARTGLETETWGVLRDFSLRLAARRRSDAASLLGRHEALADGLTRQAAVLGGAQLAAVRRDGEALSAALERAADLHETITDALARAVGEASA